MHNSIDFVLFFLSCSSSLFFFISCFSSSFGSSLVECVQLYLFCRSLWRRACSLSWLALSSRVGSLIVSASPFLSLGRIVVCCVVALSSLFILFMLHVDSPVPTWHLLWHSLGEVPVASLLIWELLSSSPGHLGCLRGAFQPLLCPPGHGRGRGWKRCWDGVQSLLGNFTAHSLQSRGQLRSPGLCLTALPQLGGLPGVLLYLCWEPVCGWVYLLHAFLVIIWVYSTQDFSSHPCTLRVYAFISE